MFTRKVGGDTTLRCSTCYEQVTRLRKALEAQGPLCAITADELWLPLTVAMGLLS
jgi:hypothetical protein